MRHMFELRDAAWRRSSARPGSRRSSSASSRWRRRSGDPERARTAETFAQHDVKVVAKLYEVHRDEPDAHVTFPTSCANNSLAR